MTAIPTLQDYLLDNCEIPEETDDINNTERQEPPIENAIQANRALRKIARARQDLKEAIGVAGAEIERVNNWVHCVRETTAEIEREQTQRLATYYAKSDKKTISLPCGKVQWRKQQPEYSRDDEALLSWLKKHKEKEMTKYIQVRESPLWGDLKRDKEVRAAGGYAVIPSTGEIIGGVTTIERPRTLRVITEEGPY